MGTDDGGRRRGGPLALAALTLGAAAALCSCSGAADASPTAAAAPATPTASAASRTSPAAAPADTGRGAHGADLRRLLVPVPHGAGVDGPAAGSTLTRDDIAVAAADQAAARRALTAYGFRAGASRTYLTADGVSEVSVRLVRFSGSRQAAAYDASQTYQGAPITLRGASPARAYRLASGSAESADTLLAVTHRGDVHVTITVTGGASPSPALLERLLDAQYRRLGG